MPNPRLLKSLHLGGDGDEVDAITDVEREFGIRLDYVDASSWRTVGDVYFSLEKALQPEVFNHADTWYRFCKAICRQTGDDAARVGKDTRLLPPSPLEHLRRLWDRFVVRKS